MEPTPENLNRLGGELSPYLLQHAANPVHWQPWDDTALSQARQLDRPVLLSIGYSACHWCHVMAHESFEDAETARLMNESFVCIKVDREERPDLDQLYQGAYALMNGRGGGWPLTVFLAPDTLLPFFAGTYYPREQRLGMPAFGDVLRHIARLYHTHRHEVAGHVQSVADACRRMYALEAARPSLDLAPLQAALASSARHFDATHGGFGGAPKFPMPAHLDLLLQAAAGAAPGVGDEVVQRALHTLDQMASAGLWDHLGGGFFRYSVDARWEIPHFEKMLYDNAGLLAVYSDAWLITRKPLYARVARGIVAWLAREMTDAGGGFYAALDADDSEGVEGGAYAWTREEVREVLGNDQDYSLFAASYGLEQAPNFEGRWHLRAVGETSDERLQTCRERLLAHRSATRKLPLDDKVLTAWNGQAIQGLARAARTFGEPGWLQCAEHAMDFLRTTLCTDGVLMRTYRAGQVRYPGYLDDHAMMLAACLELLQCRYRATDLAFAMQLADTLLARFQDSEAGGFYFTAGDQRGLPLRPRSFMDEAQPSGNGVAARGLLRLGLLLGRTDYLEAVERTLQAGWQHLRQGESLATASLLSALGEHLRPFPVVVVRGAGAELERWRAVIAGRYQPGCMTVAIPADAADLPGALAERQARADATVAYLCVDQACRPPCTSLEALLASLDELQAP